MSNEENLQLFENQPIRTAWNDDEEEWYFSIVDVVGILTNQITQRRASNYWAKLKQRLKEEGADELLTNCQQLKLKATDENIVSLMSPTLNSCYASSSPYHQKKPNHLRFG